MSDFTRPQWATRLGHLQAWLAASALDAFVVSTPQNLNYLCGFTGSAGLLVVTPDACWLATDGRYSAIVRQRLSEKSLGPVQHEPVEQRYDLTLTAILARCRAGKVGVEAGNVTIGTMQQWQAGSPAVDWRPETDVIERQRMIKDEVEIAIFRRAGRALSGVAQNLSAWVRPGRTERDVARDIDAGIERAGFSRTAFDTIVASGPNGAYPHARPTDRRLVAGDLVTLDFGGVLDGYCVDLTRVAGIGQISDLAASLYESVIAAQGQAIAAVRPGVPSSDVDRAARDVLERRGYGPAFCHGTGHGLGLEIHEAPRITRADSTVAASLEPGMVFTIEPGAYVEGLGGVRVEDDVLVTADGCEVLTESPRELIRVQSGRQGREA